MSIDNQIINATASPANEKDMKCAPTKTFNNGSCIPLNILVEMAIAYNKDYPKDQIELSTRHETLYPDKYKLYLVKQFKKKLGNKCSDQQCWTKQAFVKNIKEKMKEELQKETFRPKGPSGKFTWLNTLNIDDVMNQYEGQYKDFKYLGAVPIDFDSIPSYGIKDLSFKDLEASGKKRLGIVFNTDPHYKSGEHWISMFADLEKGQCYYFDSYGIPPEKEVRVLMGRISKYIKSKGKEPIVDYNKTQHQKKGTECGVYSMAFILRMLKGESLNDIQKTRVPDDEINKCRKKYFT